MDTTTPISERVILDLCGGTGSWSKFYREAGYDVRIIDPQEWATGAFDPNGDVRLFKVPACKVWGILAAPPCTVFALSGNRWPRSADDYAANLAVVDACIRIAFACKPQWWALENPVGTLVNWLGKPKMYFNPCDYGDPYTKRTCLWGDFTEPKRAPVEPTEGSKLWAKYGGKSARTKLMRSMTPEGFARAFFEANP